ncbi:MAG: crossover junction endodeoxyribonuclease RuvC [Candidatus Babeliales bacterium]
MIVLGIDPGFSATGYGVIKKEQTKTFLLDCGYLKLPSSKPLSVRIGMFNTYFNEKIITHHITDLALETPFLGKNAQNFLKLGYLRGILYLLANTHQLNLHEFSPREVKQAVTGFGGAQKDQVARIIMRLFPHLVSPEKSDVTDAVAVTLCAIWRQKQTFIPHY